MTPKLEDALRDSEIIHDWDAIEDAIEEMADEIVEDYEDDAEPPLFITVMHGGLHFAAQLSFALGERGMDVQFDYLHATRYQGGTSGSRLAWLHRPATPMRGRSVILVDDILDEGHTLLAIREHCLAQGAAAVSIAVLTEKRHARRAPGIGADHVCLQVPDRYVFGYGMDWHGHGRNLPAIHAVKEPVA